MAGLINLTGIQFEDWTVLAYCGPDPLNGMTMWRCRCICGTEKVIAGQTLRRGKSRSCGCTKGRRITEANTTHGMSNTRLYQVWLSMIQRCRGHGGPQALAYHERGIQVCERWQEFQNFFDDMGEAPKGYTLERKDNDGNYEPGNCVWATRQDQNVNRGNTKLTKEQVAELRKLAEEGVPGEALGRRFGISGNYARDLIKRKSRSSEE